MENKDLAQTVSAEERLKQLNAERKELKEKVFVERSERLKQEKDQRELRDKKLEMIQDKLKKTQDLIYTYNKLGKSEKDSMDILGTIKAGMEIAINGADEEITAEVDSKI